MTWETIADWLGASRYAAHSICLTSDPVIVTLFVIADGAIGVAYYAIAVALGVAYLSREKFFRLTLALTNDPVFLKLFALFIFGCGATHHTMILTLFHGVYYLDAFARAVTAAVSVVTAIRVLHTAYTSERRYKTFYEPMFAEQVPAPKFRSEAGAVLKSTMPTTPQSD